MSLKRFVKKCNGDTPSSEQISSNLDVEISRHTEEQRLQSLKSSPQRGEEAIQSEQTRTLGVQVRGLISTMPNPLIPPLKREEAILVILRNIICRVTLIFHVILSRGMSGVKVEQTSAETLSFRCVCERCRLTRGDVGKSKCKAAFSLAEVLITLGIIGVVAALTLPTLIQNYQDRQFKTAYKKVYSDISQAFQEGIVEGKFNRTEKWNGDSGLEEMNLLKEKFKIALDCPTNKGAKENVCWKKGDTICGGSCKTGNSEDGIDYEDGVPYPSSNCFVDGAGRSWCSFDNSENMFLVDTNGFAKPNRFGKDRFMFTFADKNGNRTFNASSYAKVIPYASDTTTAAWTCKHPPCYYKSWLYN